MPPGAFVRVLLLGLMAVVASGWALVHVLTHKKVPMVVPIQATTALPSEIPVPDTAPEPEPNNVVDTARPHKTPGPSAAP